MGRSYTQRKSNRRRTARRADRRLSKGGTSFLPGSRIEMGLDEEPLQHHVRTARPGEEITFTDFSRVRREQPA